MHIVNCCELLRQRWAERLRAWNDSVYWIDQSRCPAEPAHEPRRERGSCSTQCMATLIDQEYERRYFPSISTEYATAEPLVQYNSCQSFSYVNVSVVVITYPWYGSSYITYSFVHSYDLLCNLTPYTRCWLIEWFQNALNAGIPVDYNSMWGCSLTCWSLLCRYSCV